MINLSPFWQTVLTVAGLCGLLVLAGLVAAAHVGRHLVATDPRNPWGPRLVLLGVWLGAIKKSPAASYLPPPVRAILDSLPSDPPGPGAAMSIAILVLAGWAGATATGCASMLSGAQAQMDRAAKGIEAAAIVADRAEPHLLIEYRAELARCAALEDVNAIDPCTARARAAWEPVRDALQTVRAMRCAAEPGAC